MELRRSITEFLCGMLGMAPLTCTHSEAAAAESLNISSLELS
jgi:hypothetical protein